MEEKEKAERSTDQDDVKPFQRPSIIVAPKRVSNVQTQPSTSGLYKESKRAIAEREKVKKFPFHFQISTLHISIFQEEKRRKLEEETEFSPEDLSLATIPGLNFDPKERSFDLEELRPQPIIKKRSKLFVDSKEKVRTILLLLIIINI